MAYKKLFRSIEDRKIFGVCGGLGEYFDIDPLIFRIIFLFLLLCAGGGLILYLIMWLLMPEKKNSEPVKEICEEINSSEDINENNNSNNQHFMKNNKGIFLGLALVTFGLLWLGRSFDLFYFSWHTVLRLWPLLIIWIGIALFPINQIWKNMSGVILLVIAIVLLFTLPEKSCCYHFWNDKEILQKHTKNSECILDSDDDTNDDNDESITVSVDSGIITINKEKMNDGERKVIIKKIKL